MMPMMEAQGDGRVLQVEGFEGGRQDLTNGRQ